MCYLYASLSEKHTIIVVETKRFINNGDKYVSFYLDLASHNPLPYLNEVSYLYVDYGWVHLVDETYLILF